MPKLTTGGTPASYEDLGGLPQNSKPDDDSNKLKTLHFTKTSKGCC